MWILLPALVACHGQRTGPPDILLVSIDTLRADHLGTYGDSRGLTPNIDRFARESVQFQRAWTQANFTLASHAAVFYGRFASDLGPVRGDTVYAPSRNTLAAILDLYGYQTAGFTGGGMMGDCYGIQHGFGTWDAPGCTEYASLFTSAPKAMDWLAAQDTGEPSFVFVHGYDPHQPYLKPTPYGLAWNDPASPPTLPWAMLVRIHAIFDGMMTKRDDMPAIQGRVRPWDTESRRLARAWFERHPEDTLTLAEADHGALRDSYAGAVAYADAWFGWMVGELARTGRLEHTVVILMSDHGESLGEDGRYGHSHTLEERVGHVPLIVRLPGAPGDTTRARTVDADVALFDLFPTILELAGATLPADLPSHTLGPLLRGEEAEPQPLLYTESKEATVSGRSGDDLLVFSGIQPGSPWMSTMVAAAPIDGPAFGGSSTAEPARREAVRTRLLALQAELTPPQAPTTGAVTDPAVLDAMRKHGYFDAP